jgi:hypothetical protein
LSSISRRIQKVVPAVKQAAASTAPPVKGSNAALSNNDAESDEEEEDDEEVPTPKVGRLARVSFWLFQTTDNGSSLSKSLSWFLPKQRHPLRLQKTTILHGSLRAGWSKSNTTKTKKWRRR